MEEMFLAKAAKEAKVAKHLRCPRHVPAARSCAALDFAATCRNHEAHEEHEDRKL